MMMKSIKYKLVSFKQKQFYESRAKAICEALHILNKNPELKHLSTMIEFGPGIVPVIDIARNLNFDKYLGVEVQTRHFENLNDLYSSNEHFRFQKGSYMDYLNLKNKSTIFVCFNIDPALTSEEIDYCDKYGSLFNFKHAVSICIKKVMNTLNKDQLFLFSAATKNNAKQIFDLLNEHPDILFTDKLETFNNSKHEMNFRCLCIQNMVDYEVVKGDITYNLDCFFYFLVRNDRQGYDYSNQLKMLQVVFPLIIFILFYAINKSF